MKKILIIFTVVAVITSLYVFGQDAELLCNSNDRQDNNDRQQNNNEEQQNNDEPIPTQEFTAERLSMIQELLAQKQEQMQSRTRRCACASNQEPTQDLATLCHSNDRKDNNDRQQNNEREQNNDEPPIPTENFCACEAQQERIDQQNEIRLAVYGMLLMEDILAPVGDDVSEIAIEFGNSYMSQTRYENRMRGRTRFQRFLSGGDYNSADALDDMRSENLQRIGRLNMLNEQVQTGEEVQLFFSGLIDILEEEQHEMSQVVIQERRSRGMFGWFRR